MRKILLIGAALILVTAACSDDDEEGGRRRRDAPVELEGTVNDEGGNGEVSNGEVEIGARRLLLRPDLHAGRGGRRGDRLRSSTRVTRSHTFTIDSLGIDEEVEPDATVEVEVTLPDFRRSPVLLPPPRRPGHARGLLRERGRHRRRLTSVLVNLPRR